MADITKILNQPPQNIDAEASLLGSILIDSDAIVKIADGIRPGDFLTKNTSLFMHL